MTAVVLLAFALRLYHLDYQPLWRDEVDAIRFSGGPLLNLVKSLNQAGHNGPFYFVLLRLWQDISGTTEFALRYFSVLGGMLMLPLTYQVARRFSLPFTARLMAVILIATSPYLHWYSQEAKMYTWLASLILLAVYAWRSVLTQTSQNQREASLWEKALTQSAQRGHKGYREDKINKKPLRTLWNLCVLCVREKAVAWWAVFVVATSLSFYTHILAPLMLSVYVLWAIINWPRLKAHWRGWLASMALLTLPYVPLALWQMPLLLEGFNSGHPFYPFAEQMRLLLHFYTVGILRYEHGLYFMLGAVILILVGGLLVAVTARPISLKDWLALGLWFIVPPVLVYLISLRVTVFEDRYLIYILPAFYLLAAVGLTALNERLKVAGWLVLALWLGFNVWGIQRQTSNIIKADFRSAAQHIAQSGERYPLVMFQMPYLQHTFAYYFAEPYCGYEGLWTNDGRSAEQVGRQMSVLTANLPGLWLVVAEEDQWDNRHLTRQWLNDNASLQAESHFSGVSVYHYDFPPPAVSASSGGLPFKVYIPLVVVGRMACP